jgi:DNA-directed RNA polymerase specialized sigma24 family protein
MPTGQDFHDFYQSSYPRLVAQLYAATTDLALAEDVVQEAFVRAASRWSEVHHCLDRSVDDVAADLGVPAATVKTRLARGRAMLAGRLAEEPERTKEEPHARS